jgi:dienelactone hydrolase
MRLPILFALLLVATPAQAEPRLRDPWPSAAETAGIQSIGVEFPSSSPFTPAEIGSAETATATARLYLPQDSERAPPRSLPAVIMLHGSGGVLSARELTYGPQLAAMGVAALVVDSFAPRRDKATGFIERLLEITESMVLADAYAGLAFLAGRPEIDPSRVVLAGFSYGAMSTMYALSAGIAERLAPDGLRFAGHVAFYGPCIARFEDRRTTGAPLLMLYGGRDELIDPERCAAFAGDMRAGGSPVETIVYPEAVHQWDGGIGLRPIGRLLNPCRFVVAPDGTVRDERTSLTMTGPVFRRVILFLCVDNRPYLIGADAEVRARSNRDFGAFLARVLARKN